MTSGVVLRVLDVDGLLPGHRGVHHSQALEPETQTRIQSQACELQEAGLDAEYELCQVVTRSRARAIGGAARAIDADLIVLGNVESRTAARSALRRCTLAAANRTLPVIVVPTILGFERNVRVPLRIVGLTLEASRATLRAADVALLPGALLVKDNHRIARGQRAAARTDPLACRCHAVRALGASPCWCAPSTRGSSSARLRPLGVLLLPPSGRGGDGSRPSRRTAANVKERAPRRRSPAAA